VRPEEQYRHTTDKAARRRIQAEILDKYRPHVRWFVRKTIGPQHREEAEQVGCIGLLVALERYEPAKLGVDLGGAFWFFAARCVRDEIRRWEDVGVYWRKRRGAKSAVARLQRHQASIDAERPDGRTMHDELTEGFTVEDLVADVEHRRLFARFVATLTDAEREIIFSENGRTLGSRAHLSLIERARAFVTGARDGDEDRSHRPHGPAAGR
jgi:hypothetical protein